MKINTNHRLRDMIWNSYELAKPIIYTHIHKTTWPHTREHTFKLTHNHSNSRTTDWAPPNMVRNLCCFHLVYSEFVAVLFPFILSSTDRPKNRHSQTTRRQNGVNETGLSEWWNFSEEKVATSKKKTESQPVKYHKTKLRQACTTMRFNFFRWLLFICIRKNVGKFIFSVVFFSSFRIHYILLET